MEIIQMVKGKRNDPNLNADEQPVIAGVKIKDDNSSYFIYGERMMNMITFIKSDIDIFHKLLGEYSKEDEIYQYIEDHLLTEADGIELENEIHLLEDILLKHPDSPMAKILYQLLYYTKTE